MNVAVKDREGLAGSEAGSLIVEGISALPLATAGLGCVEIPDSTHIHAARAGERGFGPFQVGPPGRGGFATQSEGAVANGKMNVSAATTRAPTPDLAAIYEEHFTFVWRALLRLGVPAASAEDVAQDVFLVVRRRLPDYDSSFPLRAWLFGILRRVAKDHRRSAQRAERRLELLPKAEPAADPEHLTAEREAAALVQGCLDRLDSDSRELFVLCELEDLTGTEASAALGLNRNTLRKKIRELDIPVVRGVRSEP